MRKTTQRALAASSLMLSAAMGAHATEGGGSVANNKGRAFAIGPSVRYDSGKGWFLTLKYQKETGVRNRAEGDALWLKAVVPF